MSIPLDRLYSFLHDISNHDVIIYRFFPHGSKNLRNICFDQNDFDERQIIPGTNVKSFMKLATMPLMIAHDQEPLDFDLYSQKELINFAIWRMNKSVDTFSNPQFSTGTKVQIAQKLASIHLRSSTDMPFNVYDLILLCHSEKNSEQLKKYEDAGFVGVYWWSHAMIARDWYRYAEHDSRLTMNLDCINKDFLIYNRAWSGTREYRLKFSEMIVTNQLLDHCKMKFSAFDNGVHYQQHKYKNTRLAINADLEAYFENNSSSSTYSGDYNSKDYASTAIEVVLETMFDDQRLHLTEKCLRPIACGKPFILVSTPGALGYLRDYGFQTFDSLLDESYDTIQDPVERLNAVIDLMSHISRLPRDEKINLWTKLQVIADYNRRHFFSTNFESMIIQEYKQNFSRALDLMELEKTGKHFWWYKTLNENHGSLRYKDSDMRYVESFIKI
jgi:hypothetical protein